MNAIEFREVSKSYGNRQVLSRLSFQIEQGERVTIHGPSGSGKTTLLRLIAGFLGPDDGSILIANREVASVGNIHIGPERRNLGMVFQDLALWPHLTVYENLEFALKAQGLKVEVRKRRIEDALGRVRLEEFANVYPGHLSGGQQQRVAIARALVAQPLALLMDEPLSNLDDDLKEELCAHLIELHAQLGFTLVYVTHGKEELRKIGNRTILLKDSKEVQV